MFGIKLNLFFFLDFVVIDFFCLEVILDYMNGSFSHALELGSYVLLSTSSQLQKSSSLFYVFFFPLNSPFLNTYIYL